MPNHLVVPNSGSINIAFILRKEWLTNKPLIHLYQNQVNITLTTVSGDFMECSFPGYPGPLPLDFSLLPEFDPSNHAFLQAAPILYVNGGDTRPQRAFGYYVMDSSDSVLLWAEQFPFRVWFRFGTEQQLVVAKFGILTEFAG